VTVSSGACGVVGFLDGTLLAVCHFFSGLSTP
jgi:hypothetical protein